MKKEQPNKEAIEWQIKFLEQKQQAMLSECTICAYKIAELKSVLEKATENK